MVEWKELFEQTNDYFGAMVTPRCMNISAQDRAQVEYIQKYKFDDQDPVKQLVTTIKSKSEEMKQRIRSGNRQEQAGDKDEIIELFEELGETLEISNQNCINVCHMGGLNAILEMIVVHEISDVR